MTVATAVRDSLFRKKFKGKLQTLEESALNRIKVSFGDDLVVRIEGTDHLLSSFVNELLLPENYRLRFDKRYTEKGITYHEYHIVGKNIQIKRQYRGKTQ